VARPSEPPRPTFRPKEILSALLAHGVDFVLIGGLAGIVRGSSYPTYDLDIAYAQERDNLERLAAALRDLGATLRGAPPDVPFQLDAKTLENGAHFMFDTPFGAFDVLSDPDGAPPYAHLRAAAGKPAEVEGHDILVASLDHLIAMKETSDRPKDKLMATEYRVLSDEVRARQQET
jgi:hypothetical protein